MFALLAVTAVNDAWEERDALELRAAIAVLAHEAVPAVGAYTVTPANEENEAVDANDADVTFNNNEVIGMHVKSFDGSRAKTEVG